MMTLHLHCLKKFRIYVWKKEPLVKFWLIDFDRSRACLYSTLPNTCSNTTILLTQRYCAVGNWLTETIKSLVGKFWVNVADNFHFEDKNWSKHQGYLFKSALIKIVSQLTIIVGCVAYEGIVLSPLIFYIQVDPSFWTRK